MAAKHRSVAEVQERPVTGDKRGTNAGAKEDDSYGRKIISASIHPARQVLTPKTLCGEDEETKTLS